MLEDKLIEKSKECFTMAIEIYNKPTISIVWKDLVCLYVMLGN